MEPPMALGRVLPVGLRYCGEVSMGAGHMIYGESSHGEDHMISEGCPMTRVLIRIVEYYLFYVVFSCRLLFAVRYFCQRRGRVEVGRKVIKTSRRQDGPETRTVLYEAKI